MPKIKTNKSTAKRVKRTKNGTYLGRTMSAQHRTTGKATRVQQRSSKLRNMSDTQREHLRRLLPYL